MFLLSDLLYGWGHSQWMNVSFDIPAAELNIWGWIKIGRTAMTHSGGPVCAHTDLFFIICWEHLAVQFLRRLPVTKLIGAIIERGFNEGECSRPLNATVCCWLLSFHTAGEDGCNIKASCYSFNRKEYWSVISEETMLQNKSALFTPIDPSIGGLDSIIDY